MIDCVLLAEQCSKVTAPSLLFLLFGSNPKCPLCNCVCVCVCVFAVLKWLMASAGRTFTTPVQPQLQLLPLLFKVTTHTHAYTHTHTQVPAQHYYPLNLTCPLNSISLFIYSKWCVALCLPTSLHLSLRSSLPADCPGGDWWELWWDEAGCAHVSLSHVPGPAVSWAHPSGSGSAGRGNVHTLKHTLAHLPAVSVPSLMMPKVLLD